MGVALAALLIDNLPKIDVGMAGLKNIDYVLRKLAWMRSQRIWPNGLRYFWTDAFGLVLLVSLYGALNEEPYLDGAMELVAEVDRVLGRKRGIRIGEEPDRDGQYFHYLAMWLYALGVLGRYEPAYRDKGIALARAIHRPFVVPGRGVIWKMKEDLSGPYPGYGFGALNAFDGYVSYRLLDEQALANEIAEMKEIIDKTAPDLVITQDLGLGMMLWMTHFFPGEGWAETPFARRARLDVDRGPLFLPRVPPARDALCLHQLWRVDRPPGGRVCRAVERVCRAVPVWRRVRPGRHHPRDGVQVAFPRSLIRAGQAAARAP